MIDIISQPAEIRRRLYDQIGLRLGLHPRFVDFFMSFSLPVIATTPIVSLAICTILNA